MRDRSRRMNPGSLIVWSSPLSSSLMVCSFGPRLLRLNLKRRQCTRYKLASLASCNHGVAIACCDALSQRLGAPDSVRVVTASQWGWLDRV